jgi:hypothetical protein
MTAPIACVLAVLFGAGWWLVPVLVFAWRDRKTPGRRCPTCGEQFDRVSYFPTRMGGVSTPHYYCPNDHVQIGSPVGVGESVQDRLGGWAP